MGKNLTLAVCFVFIQQFLYAQSNNYQFKPTESRSVQVPDTSPSFPYIHNESVGYRLAYTRQSLTGKHEFYQQYIYGQQVLGSGLKVHYRHNGEIFLQTNNCVAPHFKNQPEINTDSGMVWVNTNSGLESATIKQTTTEDFSVNQERYINAEGELLLVKDLNRYFHSVAPDSLAKMHVFYPDPITSSKSSYGGNLTDNNDVNNPSLQNEIKELEIKTKFENDTFWLENDYVKMVQFKSNILPATTSRNGKFFYNRSEKGFEDVNVFYHLTRFRSHMDSIGHSNMCKKQIYVDAHGLSGDNSFYATNAIPLRILFGTGGVDDAEDATVIVHEYGHALSDYAAPKTNIGIERGALDEGLCDYFATSYKTQISDYNWEYVFPWDGHNEFNSGRTANTSRVYKSDAFIPKYTLGEIVSSALMEINRDIGRNITDQLILESLYFLDNEMTLPQYGNILLSVEEELYGGNYKEEVCSALKSYDLVNSCYVGQENLVADPSNFKLLNSMAFSNNLGPLVVEAKHPISKAVVYSSSGQVLFETIPETNTFTLEPDELESGFYILKIHTTTQSFTPKVLKLH